MGTELEFKYALSGAGQWSRLADELGGRFGPWQEVKMETAYFDTQDRLLSGRQWTLRVRRENGVPVLTAKAPGPGRARSEWELPGGTLRDLHRLAEQGAVAWGKPVDFCVPTGNFGDILAGYYAKQMGLPVGKLICASNKNNVLTDFIKTGTYDARRTFYKTTSPSMDILISSNLERLLLHTSGSAEKVEGWMQELAATGKYTVDAETLAKIQASFAAGYADDAVGAAEIRARFERDGYLCDTHTAVAFHVAEANRSDAPMVVLSTASPFKFPRDVLAALGETAPESDFAAMAALTAKTGAAAPASLRELDKLPVRFNTVIEPAEIRAAALR